MDTTTTDWAGIAAFVGAAAWVPILWRGIYVWLSKPQLDVVLGTSVELGYTTLGTILNPDLALRVTGKAALITKATIELRHQQGRELTVHWNGTSEILSQAQSKSGDHAAYTRTLSAIALQVLPNSDVVQRKFQFNDTVSARQTNEKSVALARRLDRMPRPISLAQIEERDEYADLIEQSEGAFYWEAGTYAAVLKVFVQELNEPVAVEFSFSINAVQLGLVESNVDAMKDEVRKMATGEEASVPVWNWLYPSIS